MEENAYDCPFLSGEIAKTLDFYRIRETIASLSISEETKEVLLKREPTDNIERIQNLKELAGEYNMLLRSNENKTFSSWPKVKELFSLLSIEGATLLQENVFALGLFCKAAREAKNIVKDVNIDIPHIKSLISSIAPLDEAENAIFSILAPDGSMRDLPSIRAIQNRIASLHKDIEAALHKYATDPILSSALQSTVPALRGGREVLAVRSDRRSAIKGIVHEVSPSGQTVYIEVEESVRASNELVQAEFELQAEIRKIIRELTTCLSQYKDDFILSHSILIKLDEAQAVARWKDVINGSFAQVCSLEEDAPLLLEARHPLLADKAVPITVRFIKGHRVLIITGPNTGGKTVTLKTLALFCLLNQAGFPLPAKEGTRLPIFKEIFADIGDEQSIDDSLSTFSGHMKRIALMTQNASKDSLVLLDELGSGTDPQEGGAIAMAVLDDLIKKGSFVLVTTHHGILKNYAYNNNFCTNASVEFDAGTLRPTYRILLGVPGESHAIDIARSSGLPETIIKNAKNYLDNDRADVSALIKNLTEKHSQLDALIEEAKETKERNDILNLKLKEKESELHQKEVQLKEEKLSEENDFLKETRRRLENLVRELREGEITREKTLGVRHFIDEIEQNVQEKQDAINAQKEKIELEVNELEKEREKIAENGFRISNLNNKSSSNKKKKKKLSNSEALLNASSYTINEPSLSTKKSKKHTVQRQTFEAGKEVYVGRERRRGILVQKNKDNSWTVQIGSLKMSVPLSHLMLVELDANAMHNDKAYTIESVSFQKDDSEHPAFELRLLGLRQEEAIKAVQRQLDLCAIYSFKNFSIIHGKGTGILQQAVQDILSHYPGVKDFHFASPEDGGSGKTYVELL